MNEQFLANHITAIYRLLGHSRGFSRVGSLDYSTGKFENKILKGETEVLNYARLHNGKRNLFISRAVRASDGAVSGCCTASFDVDPIRDKETAATEEQHNNAINAAKRIVDLFPGGYIASSGNGCLILYHVPDIKDFESHYAKEATLIKELQKEVDQYHVKIDPTNYSEAVVKLIGTYSTKGEPELRRCSRFLNYPVLPFRNCEKLLQRLNEIEPSKSLVVKGLDVQSLVSKFDGDRSKADYHLVSYLKKNGVGPSDALKALQANPLGRREERPDDWQRLITKIYGNTVLNEQTGKSGNYFDEILTKETKSEEGLLTGFKDLDITLGRFPKGEITTYAARSGFGKSTFACTVAERLRKSSKKVLYFSTEMHKDYIMHKLVALSCNIPLKRVIRREFDRDEEGRIKCYRQEFEKTPIKICDTFQPTIEEVRNEVITYRPDLIIFDHINQAETHWEKVIEYVNHLKEITVQEQLPLLMLCELGEPPRGKDGTPMQSVRGDVRGSQAIIFISANFVLIDNPYEVKGNIQTVEFRIAKNRYGDGTGQVITLAVDKEISKFIEGKHDDKSNLD